MFYKHLLLIYSGQKLLNDVLQSPCTVKQRKKRTFYLYASLEELINVGSVHTMSKRGQYQSIC